MFFRLPTGVFTLYVKRLFSFFLFQYSFQLCNDFGMFGRQILLFSDVLLQVVKLFFLAVAQLDIRQFSISSTITRSYVLPFAVGDRKRTGNFDHIVAPFQVLPQECVQMIPAVRTGPFFEAYRSICDTNASETPGFT